jgi:saxitoxin biosynthesis operon SxtJ-like protein
MHWSDIPFRPGSRTLRQFAALWLVFFGGLGAWQGLVRDRPVAGALLAALALGVGLLGLIKPQAVRWIYVAWMVLAFPIGWAVSRVMLAVTYYGLFTPVGLVFKLIGRDVLARRRDPHRTSYWAVKPAPADVRGYFRPF